MTQDRLYTLLFASSLVLIGTGLLWLHPPLCPLGLGLVLWIDLNLWSKERKRERSP